MVKSILITGAGRGLGRALALIFSQKGFDLILNDRYIKSLKLLKKEIIGNRVSCEIIVGDLTSDHTLESLYNIAKFREISILINNAAVTSFNYFEKLSKKQIEYVFETNLVSVVKLTRMLYPLIVNSKGTIVFINSLNGIKAEPEKTLYCSSKAGLKGFTDSLRQEAERYGVRIMGVYPSGMNTPGYAGKNRKKSMDPLKVAEKIYEACHLNPIPKELFIHNKKV